MDALVKNAEKAQKLQNGSKLSKEKLNNCASKNKTMNLAKYYKSFKEITGLAFNFLFQGNMFWISLFWGIGQLISTWIQQRSVVLKRRVLKKHSMDHLTLQDFLYKLLFY